MGAEDVFAGSFKEHLNNVYSGQIIDSTFNAADLFGPGDGKPGAKTNKITISEIVKQDTIPKLDVNFLLSPRTQPKAPEKNYLDQAINQNAPHTTLTTPTKENQNSQNQRPSEQYKAALAQHEKELAAQDYLLQHPDQMRKLWKTTYDDVTVNKNGHIDMYEIDQGLAKKSLPEAERNFLAILKQGYLQLSYDVQGGVDKDGVSAKSLLMIDKAMNRSLNEDPVYKDHAMGDIAAGALYGLWASRTGTDAKTKLTKGLLGFATVTAAFELKDLLVKYTGGYDETYDKVKLSYSSFVKDYDKLARAHW